MGFDSPRLHQRQVAATNIAIHVGGLRYFCCPKGNIHSDSFCRAAADGISFAAIFFQNLFSLILSQILSESNPLRFGLCSDLFFAFCRRISHSPISLRLLLLFRKKSRSARLFGCKRAQDGLTLLLLRVIKVRFHVMGMQKCLFPVPFPAADCRNKKIAIHVGGLRSFCCPKEISISAVSAAPNCLRVCCSALRYTPCAYK